MKAFVTGASGFIGKALVQRLVQRGDQVVALVRSEEDANALQEMGVTPALGDILDLESMRAPMAGSDVVFHLAGWYKTGSKDWRNAELVNVQGTRNVLELAHELGIPRMVYTSTLAVFGDTHGTLVDESYRMPADQSFLTEYDRSKWQAHYQVALPLIEQGAPIVIVMPGIVYGPGDTSLVGDFMRRFYKGQFPVLPGGDMTLTFAYIDDIVEGIILAAEKGRPGESYILAGPAMKVKDAVKMWAEISGRPAPLLVIPSRMVAPTAPLMGWLSKILPLPTLFSQEMIRMVTATYIARSDKARQELGWQTRPLRPAMQQTLDWVAGEVGKPDGTPTRLGAAAAFLAGILAFLVFRLFGRKKRGRGDQA